MHNTESVLVNETHKLLWNFKIQTDRLISARRQDLVIVNIKGEPVEWWTLPSRQDHWVKLSESEKRD